MQNGQRLAAVDIGSNSFRLEIGALEHGQIRRSEYLKETVRLGNGLDSARNLTPEAMQRGWDTLSRFAERLAGFEPGQVRAVATQTLREARNREEFLLRARTVLGFAIDVISGGEEARLIYQGVAHLLPQSENSERERRLVVDIGGRSTELILGSGMEPRVMASWRVGSVTWSMKYFPNGQFTEAAFHAAEVAAQAVLEEALDSHGRSHWEVAYGASGTIGAVGQILQATGGTPGVITRAGLDELRDRLLRAGSADKLRIEGMREDRKPVIGGGLSVLRAVFDLLDIDVMQVARGGLRHGVLYEMAERDEGVADLRASTVARLAQRFQVDAAQANRVRHVAATLYRQLAPAATATAHQLDWAAQLHEIGTRISHSDFHKHGAYILDNTDAPGFAVQEMHALAQLVLGQRGKLRKLDAHVLQEDNVDAVQQLLALRLAVILCHARRDPQADALQLAMPGEGRFSVACSPGWTERHPQSAHLLREEVLAWQKSRWQLSLRGT